MLNGGDTFSMGWKPASAAGFLPSALESVLRADDDLPAAIGRYASVSSDTWKAWSRTDVKFQGFEYISGHDPLFTHLNSPRGLTFATA